MACSRYARLRGANKAGLAVVAAAKACLILTAVTTAVLTSEARAEEITFGGLARTYYYSSSRELDGRNNLYGASLEPKLDLRFSPEAALHAEGRVMAQHPWKDSDASLREGYLDLAVNDADLRLGKQIVKWGRADTINPTDNLTPSDYTLLYPEDDDLKSGIPAAKATYNAGGYALTGIWLPRFQPSRIPLPIPRARTREVLPARTWEHGEYAFKIDQSGGTVDWSLSYFDGYDPMPDLGVTDRVTLTYPRIRTVGGDFASTAGKYGLRGEAAYLFTPDRSGEDPFRKNPFFFYVLGVDRTYGENLYLNFQFIQRIVTNFRDPHRGGDPMLREVAVTGAVLNNQIDEVTNSLSLKIQYKMFYETLKAEASAIYNITRSDYLIRPRVYYAITDRYSVVCGGDLYRGRKESFFGLLKDNSLAFVEFRAGF